MPAAASTRVVASPMPAEAPVITATRPASSSATPGALWEPGGYLPVTALTASCVTDTMRSSSASVMTIAGE